MSDILKMPAGSGGKSHGSVPDRIDGKGRYSGVLILYGFVRYENSGNSNDRLPRKFYIKRVLGKLGRRLEDNIDHDCRHLGSEM
jgi:hypothetical protein